MIIVILAIAILSSFAFFYVRRPLVRSLMIMSLLMALISISIGWIPQRAMPFFTYSALSSPEMIKENTAIVVLGAGLSETITGNAAIPFHAYSRISKAADLYLQCEKLNHKCTLLISGGSPAGKPSEASEYANILKKLGIPASDILIEDKSLNTWQNAKFSQPLLTPFDSVAIVTNGLHARRTDLYFRHFGVNANIIASDDFPIKLSHWQWGLNWFVFEVEIHEWLGIVRYYVYEGLGLNKTQERP